MNTVRPRDLEAKSFVRNTCENLLTFVARLNPARNRAPGTRNSVVVHLDRGHRDRLERLVARPGPTPGDGVDQVLVADEELAAVRVRPGVGHRKRSAVVVAGERLVVELVARSAGPDAAGL